MTACQRYEDRLEALHDGELTGLSRWRVGRHVASCAHCRAELDSLRGIGEFLREEVARDPAPDLWAAIAARLPELDAGLERRSATAVARPAARRRRFAPLPIGLGGLVAAAAVLVLWLKTPGLPAPDAVIEDLDSMGRPVAVLPADEKSTIIWVLDPKPVASGEGEAGAQI
ncbi:hypothetical protein MYXO_03105 [Myxococcaceae bacterium]|nr:hypothetical protein MYXO_03105 [Myxococcaceae bacterium]